MTEESDLFCMLLSACRGRTACFRLRTEAAAGREKIFPWWCFPIVQRTWNVLSYAI